MGTTFASRLQGQLVRSMCDTGGRSSILDNVTASDRTTFVGLWCHPDRPDEQIPGTLKIGTHQTELELHLVNQADEAGGNDGLSIPSLHGRSMGACLTLLNIIEVSHTSTVGVNGVRETHRVLSVETVLIGNNYPVSATSCTFNRASFRLSNLDEWANRSPYRWSRETMEIIDLPTLRAVIPGCEITLSRVTVTHFGRLTDSGFTSHEVVGLKFDDAQPLDELEYRFIRPLEQLLTLATGTFCTAFDLKVGNDSNGSIELRRRWPLTAYTVRRRNTDMAQQDGAVIRAHMRFGMNCSNYPPDVDFGEFIPRWFTLQAQLGTVCDLIFSLRSETGGYLQQQMFSIASALEGLHRCLNPQYEKKSTAEKERNSEVLEAVRTAALEHHDWLKDAIGNAHRKSYSFRIREMLNQTDHLIEQVVGDETRWPRHLRDIRDGIGHVLTKQDEWTVQKMVAMLYSAQMLAELVLLRELGFTDAQCCSSLGHHWELDQVREQVEKAYPAWFVDHP